MTPDLDEVLLESEKAKAPELLALYNAYLGRNFVDAAKPGALEAWEAWEVVKELWRIKRAGCDMRVVQELVVDAQSHSSAGRELWREMDERARLRKVAADNIVNLRRIGASLRSQGKQRQVIPFPKVGNG